EGVHVRPSPLSYREAELRCPGRIHSRPSPDSLYFTVASCTTGVPNRLPISANRLSGKLYHTSRRVFSRCTDSPASRFMAAQLLRALPSIYAAIQKIVDRLSAR